MAIATTSQPCLVTGGTGYIGLHLVNLLLERGYTVHTTVRSLAPGNEAKLQPLRDLQKKHSPERLRLFEADLMREGSFAAGMAGCAVVYHVASPFLTPPQIRDGDREIVQPALKGTRNVLQTVEATESVRRVVLTSSIIAVQGDISDIYHMKDHIVSEEYFNETCTPTYGPYGYSKVAAEKLAWEMCRGQTARPPRWDMVAVLPAFVLGPPLAPGSVSGSLYLYDQLWRGDFAWGALDLHYTLVDVRDVAAAHVAAGEKAEAGGQRFLVSNTKSVGLLQAAAMARPIHKKPRSLPRWNIPKPFLYVMGPLMGLSWRWIRNNMGIPFELDNSKSVKQLGIVYRPTEQVVREHYLAWAAEQEGKK